MEKIKIQTNSAPKAIGPYSQAIRLQNLLFCSGQLPLSPSTGKIVEGGVATETHEALKNLSAILEASGTSLKNVIKTTIFLRDMNDFAEVNKIYGDYFQDPYPARATVQVARLPLDAAVEIEAIAYIP